MDNNTPNTNNVKKKRIKNELYNQFLDKGLITLIQKEHIDKAVTQIKGKYQQQHTSCLYTLYLTGARPIEILELKPKNHTKEKNYLRIDLPPAKNGLARPFYISIKHPYAKYIWKYSQTIMPEMYLYWKLRGKYTRTRTTKNGNTKTYNETSRPLRYHLTNWFKTIFPTDIIPYYLRHNRFSKLAENGATPEEIRQLKGAKTITSVTPYLHLSTQSAKKIARKIN
jgi:site-specific recombinase XerD